MSRSLHIIIACGGTGGHLFPGIAVAEALRARGHSCLLLISQKKVDAEASAKYSHLDFTTVPAVAKPSTFSPKMIPFLWKTWQSIRHCRKLIQSFNADAVLGMGGFTSLPPIMAAHQLGLQSFVHDSNALPGRANRLTSRFCTQVFLGLDQARSYFPSHTCVHTGTPVRPEILHLPDRATAAATFGLDPNRPTILITGGSQGARHLNDLCSQTTPLLPANFQVLHVTGSIDLDRITSATQALHNHHTLGFCNQMAHAYACSDLIITRSGASSLTEVSIAGLPSILVPFPYAADDHQTRNAEVFANAGAAHLIQETALSPEILANLITSTLQDLPSATSMAKAARTLAFPDAADRVCQSIEDSLNQS